MRGILDFFKTKTSLCERPKKVHGSIRLEREGEERLLSIGEYETITGAAFIPQIDFQDAYVKEDLMKRADRHQRNAEITREQIWLGCYYRKEIETLFFPDVVISWIGSSVGWGVFANRDFKEGEYLAEYGGMVRKRRREDKKNAFCFEYSIVNGYPTPYTIDARDQGGIARYINHSDQPNLTPCLATFDRISHVILLTKKKIPKGAQLLYDYGPDYWQHRKNPIILDTFS